jgi:hypothetical protein
MSCNGCKKLSNFTTGTSLIVVALVKALYLYKALQQQQVGGLILKWIPNSPPPEAARNACPNQPLYVDHGEKANRPPHIVNPTCWGWGSYLDIFGGVFGRVLGSAAAHIGNVAATFEHIYY